MTPRQIMAYMFLYERRRDRDLYAQLWTTSLGTHGSSEQVQKQLDQWEKEQ
jgi:hypothetical protein